MLQKEVKVKILKDSIHLLVSRSPPPAGGSGQQLTSELEGVLANYHKLCDRFKSKCHTLEVRWDLQGAALRVELLKRVAAPEPRPDPTRGWFLSKPRVLQLHSSLFIKTERKTL